MVLEVHIDGYIFPLFPAKIAANWLSVCFGFVKLDGKRHEWWKIIARIIRHTVRRIRRGRPKSPSGVSFNTGRPPRSAPIRSWRSSVGKTNDINTVTQSVRIVWPLFFCPFSAEHTANQAAGFTTKSAAFFVPKKFFEIFSFRGSINESSRWLPIEGQNKFPRDPWKQNTHSTGTFLIGGENPSRMKVRHELPAHKGYHGKQGW